MSVFRLQTAAPPGFPFAKQLLNGLNRSGMSTVSEQLRQARQAQNLTVAQVAEITKIRSDHLRALEEGNFDVFSAPVYIRGFTRTYSTLLKLDVPQVMAALDRELGETQKFSEPPPLSSHKRTLLDFFMLQLSKMDWRKSLIGAAVLFICAAVWLGSFAWRRYRAADPLKGLKPGLYQGTQHLSGETLPLPSPAPRR
jgi:cytoskeletal protein RodZ